MLSLIRDRRSILTGAISLLVLGLASGCGISPKPEPPDDGEFNLELGQLITDVSEYDGSWIIHGGPGSADPPGALVRAFNLDSEEAPGEGVVQQDGSFELELLLDEGDETRIQLIDETGGRRSDPLDFIVGLPASHPTASTRALADCFTLTPPLEIDTALSHSVVIHNGCPHQVQIAQPTLRSPTLSGELSVGVSEVWPVDLSTDGQITIDVQYDGAAGAIEDIFFVTVVSPVTDRRPITALPTSP